MVGMLLFFFNFCLVSPSIPMKGELGVKSEVGVKGVGEGMNCLTVLEPGVLDFICRKLRLRFFFNSESLTVSASSSLSASLHCSKGRLRSSGFGLCGIYRRSRNPGTVGEVIGSRSCESPEYFLSKVMLR